MEELERSHGIGTTSVRELDDPKAAAGTARLTVRLADVDDLLAFVLEFIIWVLAVPMYLTRELLKELFYRGDYRLRWWSDRSNYASCFLGFAFWIAVGGAYLLVF